jgi:hypothetical protein
MNNAAQKSANRNLPVVRSLTTLYILTMLITILMTTASLAGLINPGLVYPRDNLRHSYLVNDLLNLIIGVPILVIAMLADTTRIPLWAAVLAGSSFLCTLQLHRLHLRHTCERNFLTLPHPYDREPLHLDLSDGQY